MAKFTPADVNISTEELFDKFKGKNKHKIPEEVRIDRVSENFVDDNSGVMIPAYALCFGLCLPFPPLIREILSRLQLAPFLLGPNCWRIMLGILALNRICNINLGWNEFRYCYVVKRNAGPTHLYYFSPREKGISLVTGLPHSERGEWKGQMIYLRGKWERQRGDALDAQLSVPTKATGNSTVKVGRPQKHEVNLEDLNKAWSWKHRKWDDLIYPPDSGRGTVEAEVTLQAEVNETSDRAWESMPTELLGTHSTSAFGGSIEEITMTINVNNPSSTTRKIFSPGIPCYSPSDRQAAPATAGGTLFPCGQNLHNSVVHAPISNNISPSLPPHPSHDNQLHCLDNNNVNPHDQAGTGIDPHYLLKSFGPDVTRYSPSDQQAAAAAGGTLFHWDQNLHNSVVHAPISNNSSPSLPLHPSHDNQVQCLDNNNVNPHDQAGTGIDPHYLLKSFGPDVPCYSPSDQQDAAAAAAGTLFHCDQNLHNSVVHAPISNDISPSLPLHPSHDNQDAAAAAGGTLFHCDQNLPDSVDQPGTEIDNDFVNALHPSSSEKDIDDQQGISQQHLSDSFQKDIQLLEQHKPFEEGGSEAAQSVQRDERQNKEHEEFKLPVGKEAVGTKIPYSDIFQEILQAIADVKKDVEEMKAGSTQVKEEMKAGITQVKEEMKAVTTKVEEISLRGQQNGTPNNSYRESTSSTGNMNKRQKASMG